MSEVALQVLDGIALQGNVNTPDDTLVQQIAASIRRGYPQVRAQAVQGERVCLVGGGPSLNDTADELRDLVFAGAKVVTVNGAYHWCLERNIRPSAQIVLDARPTNTRFIEPAIPQCRYLLASQCHPSLWDAVEGRPDVWIWHAVGEGNAHREVLDRYYLGRWHGIPGGTTVAMRAIALLRMVGFVRMDLFGIDSCWMGAQHHAFAQPENEADRRYRFVVAPTGHPELGRRFVCSPWHMKQFEDFLQLIRVNGDQFLLNVHGDGLLAFALRASADLTVTEVEE
jgi:hypothetical protein